MRMLNSSRRCLMASGASILGLSAALGGSLPAMAQDAAGGTQLQEVVVQARRVEENIQQVPIAVTAVSAEMIREKGIVSAYDLQRVTPGLQTTQNPRSDDNVRFTVRGQSQADVTLTTDSSVGIYVDGIYQPRVYGLRIALFDVDHVEILKGPQGTLYGKNTTGGAVNIFSRTARIDETGGYAEGTIGDYETFRFKGAVNVPLIEGKLAGRLALNYDTTTGFGKTGTGQRLSDHDAYSVRGLLTARPTENLEVRAMASYTRFDGGGPFLKVIQFVPTAPGALEAGLQLGGFTSIGAALGAGQTVAGLSTRGATYIQQVLAANTDPFNSGGTRPTAAAHEGFDANLAADWSLAPDVTLKSLTGYKRFQRALTNDFDGTNLTIAHTQQQTNDRFFSQEFNLTGKLLDGRLAFATGVYYSDEKGRDQGYNNILPVVTGSERTVGDLDVRNKSDGIYGQATYNLTERFSLTGGLRYSEDRRRIVTRARAIALNGGAVTCNVPRPAPTAPCQFDTGNLKSDAVSYTANAAYQVTDDINVYAATRRGYRAGGWNTASSAAVGPLPFEPETTTDYELGVKSELFDRRVRLNVAAFTSDYKNIQKSTIVFTSTGTSVSAIANAATATIRGVEAELLARITTDFQVDATATYTDAFYRSFPVRNAAGAITGDRSDEPFEIPKYTFSAGARYSHDLPVGRAIARLDWYWRDDLIFASTASLKPTEQFLRQNAFGLLDARLEWSVPDRGFSVALVGKNLTDKRYYSAGTDGRALGFAFVQMGEPRWVGLEVRKSFGGE
jgi:iron complex outermembrane receptor protein